MRVCIHSSINIHSRGSLRLFSPAGVSAPEADRKGEAAFTIKRLNGFNHLEEEKPALAPAHLDFRTGLEVFPLLTGNFALCEI